MELVQAIANYKVVGVDTNLFIYAYQENPVFLPLVRPLFERLDTDPGFRLVTSIITLIELTTMPLRVGRVDLVSEYTRALTSSSSISLLPVDLEIAREAAALRAKFNLRTPDAIQVASSVVGKAEAFITNDARLKNVQGIPVLILSDFRDSQLSS